MSCRQSNIELRLTGQKSMFSPRYTTIGGAIIVPVFCVCMIAAMGSLAGIRQVVTMQFDIDRNTEFISLLNAINFDSQIKIFEESI
jgi:hypothetical protein